MSEQLISRSADLKKLRDEGFNVTVQDGLLILRDVPYVTDARQIERGILISKLQLRGEVTAKPSDHVAFFIGKYPCTKSGARLQKIVNSEAKQALAPGIQVDFTFSSKPKEGYTDYYDKMTNYAALLANHASAFEPRTTPRTFPAIATEESASAFHYTDTASSRAEIISISAKLTKECVGIIGLGGTGAYVLDLVAKTPVEKILIFDDDAFQQHNAFRSPGAPSLEELENGGSKAARLGEIYSRMHRRVHVHEVKLDSKNLSLLNDLTFIFICIDQSEPKQLLFPYLDRLAVPFVDVGMGIGKIDDAVQGILRVTLSTPQQRDHVPLFVSLADTPADGAYGSNIQIAELNSLSAALAVIKWKKLRGFYLDLECEHQSTYTVDGNQLTNQVKREG